MMLPAQRPARIIIAVAALVCFGIWYTYQPDTILRCEVPILVEQQVDTHHSNTGATTGRIKGSEPPASVGNYSRIAKVSVATNKLDNSNIHRALKTHERHNNIHGYQHFVAAHEAVSKIIEHDNKKRPSGAWTKPAYLLSLIVAELQKEEEDRLAWLFWFDADTVILNPQTPLEVFMPPTWNEELENVHLLMASNWDGLNSGAFALKVAPWSVSLLSAVLAYPIYQAPRQQKDRFRDQSAFQWLLQGSDSPLASMPLKGRDHWVEVPMRWFNSIPFNNAFGARGNWILSNPMSEETFEKGTTELYNDGNPAIVKPWKVMRGDMTVHFAGTTAADVRDSWLGPWLDRAEAELPEWSNASTQIVLQRETTDFWNRAADRIASMRTMYGDNGQMPQGAASLAAAKPAFQQKRPVSEKALDEGSQAGSSKTEGDGEQHESSSSSTSDISPESTPVISRDIDPISDEVLKIRVSGDGK